MGLLKAMLVNTGAAFIGAWPSEGYSFETSASEEDGLFVGLALDEDNQSGETSRPYCRVDGAAEKGNRLRLC